MKKYLLPKDNRMGVYAEAYGELVVKTKDKYEELILSMEKNGWIDVDPYRKVAVWANDDCLATPKSTRKQVLVGYACGVTLKQSRWGDVSFMLEQNRIVFSGGTMHNMHKLIQNILFTEKNKGVYDADNSQLGYISIDNSTVAAGRTEVLNGELVFRYLTPDEIAEIANVSAQEVENAQLGEVLIYDIEDALMGGLL